MALRLYSTPLLEGTPSTVWVPRLKTLIAVIMLGTPLHFDFDDLIGRGGDQILGLIVIIKVNVSQNRMTMVNDNLLELFADFSRWQQNLFDDTITGANYCDRMLSSGRCRDSS